MNTKLHAVTDANGRPISLFMTAGQVSDYTGAAALLDSLPRAQWLLGDRGYDADFDPFGVVHRHLSTAVSQPVAKKMGLTVAHAGRRWTPPGEGLARTF